MTEDEAIAKWGFRRQVDVTPNFEGSDTRVSLVPPASLQAQHPGQYFVQFDQNGDPQWGNINYDDAAGGMGPLLVLAAAAMGNPELLGLGSTAGAGEGAGLIGSGMGAGQLSSLGIPVGYDTALSGTAGALGGMALGSQLGGMTEAVAAAPEVASGLPSWLTANAPEIGGTLQELAFPGAAAPYAAYPAAEMSMALPGWVPTETTIPSLVAEGSAVPGSFWENVSTPFKTAANILEEGAKSPIAKTLGNAKKVYDIYGALTQDSSVAPQQVSAQQSAPRRGYMSQPFGNRNFDSYR